MNIKNIVIIGFIISIIFGCIFIGVGVGLKSASNNIETKIDESQLIVGEITDILVDKEGNHEVYVSYELNNQNYDKRLNTYTSSMEKGESINLYLNENGEIYVEETGNIFSLVSLIFQVFGVIWVICMIPTFIVIKIFTKKYWNKTV